MEPTEKQINDLIGAWKADFGETLTLEEAHAEAARLLDFFAQFSEGLARIKRRNSKSFEDDQPS